MENSSLTSRSFHWGSKPKGAASLLLPVATAILALAIFALDTATDYAITVATFYVVVVLLSLSFCSSRGVIYVSCACIALTVTSSAMTYFQAPHADHRAGLVNTLIGVLAIGATTYLAVKIEHARSLAQEAQDQLAHVSRVTTLGELAASIAHEVNQPLAAIVTNADAGTRWLDAQPPNLDKATHSIRNIVADANRASEIIARVRVLAKRAEPKRGWIDINDAVEEVIALMGRQFQDNRVVLYANLARDLPLIFGDRIQLQQVVLNLLINALEAVAGIADGDRSVSITSAKSDAPGVSLTVQDSGIGIAENARVRLFDAFYTTKPDGMGMGLTICRSIIEAHGGELSAAENRPRGAVFTFTLPSDRGVPA